MYVPNIPQIVLSILSRSGADRWADAPLLLLLVTAAPLLPDWDWCWAHNEDLHRATQQWNRDLHDCLHPDPPPKYLDIVHTPTFGWGSLATTGNEIAWTKEKPKHAKPLPCDFDEVLHHIICIYKVEVLLVFLMMRKSGCCCIGVPKNVEDYLSGRGGGCQPYHPSKQLMCGQIAHYISSWGYGWHPPCCKGKGSPLQRQQQHQCNRSWKMW